MPRVRTPIVCPGCVLRVCVRSACSEYVPRVCARTACPECVPIPFPSDLHNDCVSPVAVYRTLFSGVLQRRDSHKHRLGCWRVRSPGPIWPSSAIPGRLQHWLSRQIGASNIGILAKMGAGKMLYRRIRGLSVHCIGEFPNPQSSRRPPPNSTSNRSLPAAPPTHRFRSKGVQQLFSTHSEVIQGESTEIPARPNATHICRSTPPQLAFPMWPNPLGIGRHHARLGRNRALSFKTPPTSDLPNLWSTPPMLDPGCSRRNGRTRCYFGRSHARLGQLLPAFGQHLPSAANQTNAVVPAPSMAVHRQCGRARSAAPKMNRRIPNLGRKGPDLVTRPACLAEPAANLAETS